MSLKDVSLDILHYLLRFVTPPDLCQLGKLSHLWRSLTNQNVIWKPLTVDRWDIDLDKPEEMENQLKNEKSALDDGNIMTWKNIYKRKYLQYKKYEKLLDQVNGKLFEQIRSSYSVELGEYVWEKLDTVNSIK